MLPRQLEPVSIYRGDSAVIADCTFEQPAGTPINLSSYTWRAQWRSKVESADAIDLQVVTAESTLGRLVIRASAEQTARMAGNGVWDLQGTLSGEVRTWVRGSTILVRDVTRP